MMYDKSWKCKVNGKVQNIEKAYNAFIGVKLDNGINNVELTFTPNGRWIGIISCTLAGILLVIVYLNSRKNIVKLAHGHSIALGYIFMLLYAAVVIMVYLIPIFFSFASWLK